MPSSEIADVSVTWCTAWNINIGMLYGLNAFKLQTPANHPEESVQHSERGESLKSGINLDILTNFIFVCFVFQVNAK
jgi:hypothetical protein